MTTRKSKLAALTKQSKAADSWIDALEAVNINEQNWCCMVIMLVETLPEHTACVELFDEGAETGCRRAIYPLTFKTMIHSIKTLSKVDREKCPVVQGVMHHANEVISENDISNPWLVARVVKYLVLRAKTEAITQKERDMSHGNEVDRELQAMMTVEKIESQRSMKSSKSKKSAQAVEAEPQEKTNTRLRRFGEEWRDKVYVDDAPKGGPDLYVILTGFRDAALPLELIKAGVPLTCILKIKHPGEMLDIIQDNQGDVVNNDNQTSIATEKSFSRLNVALHDFWSTLDKSSNNPENFDDYSSIIFRNFCPPRIPTSNQNEEAEGLKIDLYDRICTIVYDLYDLQCLHVDYIASMKIENVPTDILQTQDFSVYRSIMDAVPAECAFVEVILQAMLAQIEVDLQNDKPSVMTLTESESESQAKSKSDVKFVRGEPSSHSELLRSLSHSGIPTDRINLLRMKLDQLNEQYNIKLKKKQPKIQEKMLDVILEDDTFRLRTYHVDLADDVMKLVNPRPRSLADLAMRSLRDPRVIDLWKFRENVSETSKEKNHYQLEKLTSFFNGSVDSGSLVHYLHLQAFDKMIHGYPNRTTADRCKDNGDSITRKAWSPSAKRSDPFPLSTKTVPHDPTFVSGENPISNLRGFDSDSIIDYGKNICDIFECPELFGLTDAREMLQPGFHERETEKVRETQAAGPSVAKFTDVRILSKNVFLQMAHNCLGEFDGFHSRYIETTDSVLLHFYKNKGFTESDDHCNGRVLKIVTPVCLRNFCEYVISEEDEWIREMEMNRSSTRLVDAGQLTRKLSQHIDINTVKDGTFTDDDFVLPNSLKGQARKSHQEKLSDEIAWTEIMSKNGDNPSVKIRKISENVKTKKKKKLPRSSLKKMSKEIKAVDNESSSVATSEVPAVGCAHRGYPYKFVGYNLGNRRVQLTTHNETFASADGTRVKVERDEWLYRMKSLGIGIHLSGCFLKLEHTIGQLHDDEMHFHFITETGIVMAFAKTQQLEESSTSGLIENRGPQFDFRASWPSSLLVKPVRDDNFVNSFHVVQRYISKGPECEPVSRENYRKFLRNGTVLKFLDDDAVEVMRPNGTIVRCLEFEKFRGPRDFEFERDGELTKDEIGKHKNPRSSTSTRTRRKPSSPGKQFRRTSANDRNKKMSTGATSLIDNIVECCVKTVFKVYRRTPKRTQIVTIDWPDGTRITTGFVVETEPLITDWTDEEFIRFFENVSDRRSGSGQGIHRSYSSDVTRSDSYRSTDRRSIGRTDRLAKLSDDGFVSILMTCRMEHDCYTTVAYDEARRCCKLSMPDGVVVEISPDGLYDVSVGENIELRIRNDKITLSSRFNENDGKRVSTSVYNLRQSQSRELHDAELFVTVDSLGKHFKVFEDGSVVRDKNIGFTDEIPSNSNQERQRLFAINRDFTAYEYLDKSKRDENERKMNSDGRSSVISVAIPNRATELEYRLSLSPLEPTNYSKMWLQKTTELKRTNHDRTDLSRSTYSTPYDRLFPFGRHGSGIRKNTVKVPLVESIREGHPRVLTLKVFEKIAKTGENVLTELHNAMARYWPTAINGRGPGCTFSRENWNRCYESKSANWVRNLALGIESNISLETYLNGVTASEPKPTAEKIHRAPERAKSGQRRIIETEEILWYKKCLKEGIVIPYFDTIQGSCFLSVMACVDEAFQLARK